MIPVQVEEKRETSEIHGTNINKRVTIINSKPKWESFGVVGVPSSMRSFIINIEEVT